MKWGETKSGSKAKGDRSKSRIKSPKKVSAFKEGDVEDRGNTERVKGTSPLRTKVHVN